MEARNPVALFGGSFDPIHNGHLLAAEEVREKLSLEKVIFVPAARSPHKQEREMASARHRLMMAVIATNDNPAFSVSGVETDRGGKSYTVDTVRALEKSAGAALHLIIGSDTVLEFSTWKEAAELTKRCRILVVNRPGYEFKKYFSNQLVADSVDSSAGDLLERMEIIDVKGLDVSSTEVRDLVHQGKSIRYLVPAAVEEYIRKHKVYSL